MEVNFFNITVFIKVQLNRLRYVLFRGRRVVEKSLYKAILKLDSGGYVYHPHGCLFLGPITLLENLSKAGFRILS